MKSHCHKPARGLLSRLAVGLFFGTALVASAREDIKVYRVPKPAKPAATGLPAGHPPMSEEFPKIKYTTPDGWVATPGGAMRVASFSIKQGDQTADMSVIPLPGSAGGDPANINRWRAQVGLPPLDPVALKKTAEAASVGAVPAELYDLPGTNNAGDPARILGVILPREGTAWFFKMTGDESVVSSQKAAFVAFLKSIEFTSGGTRPPGLSEGDTMPPARTAAGGAALPEGHPPIAAQPATAPVNRAGQPLWTVPAGWKEVSGGDFLVAKFQLVGDGNAQAAVNVSRSAGDGGGVAGNVNRWRGQLGLSVLPEAEATKSASSLKVDAGEATLVEMVGKDARTGQPAKLVGAILLRPDQSWFYKLMGDAKVVDAHRTAFIQFVTTAQY